jgi:hypothetical protein
LQHRHPWRMMNATKAACWNEAQHNGPGLTSTIVGHSL